MRNSVQFYIALQDTEKDSFIAEKGQEEYDRLIKHLETVPSVKDYKVWYMNQWRDKDRQIPIPSQVADALEPTVSEVPSALPEENQ